MTAVGWGPRPKLSARSLVDVQGGLVSREVFVNEEVFRQEQEQVFARAWLFVGHESQIRKPGDYFTSYMGDTPVILSRDRQGRIHVFANSCRHRGMKVCRYDEGNTPIFTCPYHGWSYALDGKLVGVPRYRDAYYGDLDKSQWGLIEVAKLYDHHGLIWATWDADAPPFLDYLGDFRVFLDPLVESFAGEEGAVEVEVGVQKWLIPSNWKFVSENFAGDHYHSVSHISAEAVGIGPGRVGEYRHGDIRMFRAHLTCFPELGHGWRGGPPEAIPEDAYPFPRFEKAGVDAYCRQAYRRRLDAGKWPPVWLFGGGGNVFPNTSFHAGFPRTIVVAHPRGATSTEMWRWYLIDRDAPPEVKDHFRHYHIRYSGPGGMAEQDDMENWNYATAASKATISRRYPYNYQQALGHWKPYPGLRGAVVSDGEYSEVNALMLYKRWADFMDAESWGELAPDGAAAAPRGETR